jgi:large subunit ribosomal protein L11
MSKEIIGYLKLQIKGGDAKPAPPIAPALGSKGLSQHMMEFCKQFNARTQDKLGELLPVLITIYKDKTFDFVIKTPAAAVSIMKKIDLKKGSEEPNRKKVGVISWEQLQEIAAAKMPDLNTTDLEAATKMVAGTARSMGVSVKKDLSEVSTT